MWILQLNDMRSSKVGLLTAVAKAETKEALLAFLDREKVLAYSNGQWLKTFRHGGPLEWFNPPYSWVCSHLVDMGTREEYVLCAVGLANAYWDNEIDSLPTV